MTAREADCRKDSGRALLMTAPSGETVVEAENYTNLEMRKIQDWAQNNKLKFHENKSKVMLMSRRKRMEKRI